MQSLNFSEPKSPTNQVNDVPVYQTAQPQAELGQENIITSAKPWQLFLGRIVYLALVFGFVGLFIVWPAVYLWQQEHKGQVSGVQESEQKASNLTDQKSSAELVYVYDPQQQSFVTKNPNNQTNKTPQTSFTEAGKNPELVNLNPTNPVAGVTFAEAFALARQQLGPNAVFEWNGQLYTTNLASEVKETTSSVRNLFAGLNPKQKFQKDSTSRVLEIDECNLNVKYPMKTANGALVDFDRFNPPAPGRPFWNFYAFTGYRTPTEKFGEGYTVFVQCFYVAQMSQAFQTSLTGKNNISPTELYRLTGWFIADESIQNLQMSQNKDLGNAYSVVFTRKGILYSLSFMAGPKDENDQIGGLYAYQIQLQFQDWVS